MNRSQKAWRDTSENHPNLMLAEGGAWHEPEMVRRGWTTGRLAKARRSFGIVAWCDRFGGWHYPKWQFSAAGQVMPDVARILRLLRSQDTLYVMSHFLFQGERRRDSLLELIRSGRGDSAVAKVTALVQEIRDEPSPSPKQTRELKRRLAEIDEPAHYVVLSSLLPKWTLVYDVQRNVYGHNHVPHGAIIRDRKLAECIAQHLADGKRQSDLHVLPVRETKRGYRALEDIPGRKGEKPWRPKFHVSADIPVFVPIITPDTREGRADAMLFVAEHREQLLALLDDCNDREAARRLFVDKCRLTPRQADAVLSMPLVRLTRTAVAHFADEQEGKRRKRKLIQK